MKKIVLGFIALTFTISFICSDASGEDLTLANGGRVTVELVTSDAAYSNTLSLASPAAAIATDPNGTPMSGCKITSTGFGGLPLLSEKTSLHGCRVELDADPGQAGIQPFAANAVLSFNLCAQTDSDPACEYVWSSEPSSNTDGKNHVQITSSGNYNLLRWEDRDGLGDEDFNDLIVVVRVAQDTDGDGLWDDWELSGIDTDGDGTTDFTLPGANVNVPDIYIELDYMDCATAGGDCAATDTHTHEPKAAAITQVVQAFANAGITLHVDIDDAIPHQNIVGMGCFNEASPTTFDNIKNNATYFGPSNPRRFAYHYVVFGHQQMANSTSSGCGEVNGNDFLATLGHWNYRCQGGANAGRCCPAAINGCLDCPGSTCQAQGDVDGDSTDDHDVGTINQQAGTLMHELGHNLNLQHGGDECWNYKPNYLSIMNYWFQSRGIPPDPDGAGPLMGRVDYSGTDLADLDERSVGGLGQLNETRGIQDGTDDTRYVCPAAVGGTQTGAGTGAIDWNCDGDGGIDANVSVNLNGDCVDVAGPGNRTCECDSGETDRLSILTGYDDWTHLKYDFQNSQNFEDGVRVFPEGFVVADIEYPTHLLIVNAPPIAAAGPDQTAIECSGTQGAIVTLNGSGSRDPDGDPLTYVWVSPFETKTGVEVQMQLPPGANCVVLTVDDGNGGSARDTVCVTVVDTTPPVIECNAPSVISPSQVPVAFTVTATDICQGSTVVEITNYDCFMFAKNGKRIDKTESCEVSFAGNTITISDSGGVGDHIVWNTSTADNYGNSSTKECSVIAVNPVQP